jgi:hypothetical protein
MARPCYCRTRPSPCGLSLGLHARGIVHDRRARAAGSRRPCYGRRTDCARGCRSGWTAVCYRRRREARCCQSARPPPGWGGAGGVPAAPPPRGGGGGGGVTALQPAGIERNGSSRQRLYNVLLLLRYGRGTVLEEILRIVSALWAWWRVPSPLALCQAGPHMRRPRTAVRTVYGLRDTPRNYDRKKRRVERDWHPSVYMHESDRGRSDLT